MALFVSHSSKDRATIADLLTALRGGHQQVWLDEELGGGEAWWRTILEQIRSCEVFVFALSNNSLASKPCQAELRYAEELHRPILPVQIGPVDSVRVTPLAATQIIDYRHPTADTGIRLIEAVHERQAQLHPLPSPLPEEPPIPFAYLMRLARTISSAELSPGQQAGLVSELRTGLHDDRNDPAACRDVARLLHTLRDRSDVTYRTRTDIDALLASIGEEIATPPEPGTLPVTGRSADADSTGPQRPAFLHRWAGWGGRSRTNWLIAGGAGLAVAAVVALLLARPWQCDVTPLEKRLDSMLLGSSDVNTIMGAADMELLYSSKTAKLSSAVAVSPVECWDVVYPGLDRAYHGEERLAWKVLEEPGGLGRAGEGNRRFVDQAVAVFTSAPDQAFTLVETSARQWKTCAGQTATAKYPPPDASEYSWTIGNLTGDPPKISQLLTQRNGHGYACQRVLTAVSNFVIDVKACGSPISDEASRIADKIAANVHPDDRTKF